MCFLLLFLYVGADIIRPLATELTAAGGRLPPCHGRHRKTHLRLQVRFICLWEHDLCHKTAGIAGQLLPSSSHAKVYPWCVGRFYFFYTMKCDIMSTQESAPVLLIGSMLISSRFRRAS